MEHEYIAIVPELFKSDMPMVIGVDKVGVGILGKTYTGTWDVYWYDNGFLRTYTVVDTVAPKRHDQVAALAGQVFTDGMNTEEDWTVYDRVNYWASRVLDES